MKKIVLILLSTLICLCGCSNSTLQTNGSVSAGQSIKGDYTGFWEHTEYPNAYSVIVYEQKKDSLGFVVLADRIGANGMPAQMASVRQENVKVESGEAHFQFRDSFGNSGSCRLQLTSDKLTFDFNVIGGYQGNWCIDAGNGSYKKTKELSELDWFDKDEYELVTEADVEKVPSESHIEQQLENYLDKGTYYFVDGYVDGEDIYDEDISIWFPDVDNADDVRFEWYDDGHSYYYKVYSSDQPDYNFLLKLNEMASENEITYYVKIIKPRTIFELYDLDGILLGQYEYSDYAHRNYRYDYEYKEFYNKPSSFKREK